MTIKTLSIIQKVKLIDKKDVAIINLDKKDKTFVIYIDILKAVL